MNKEKIKSILFIATILSSMASCITMYYNWNVQRCENKRLEKMCKTIELIISDLKMELKGERDI